MYNSLANAVAIVRGLDGATNIMNKKQQYRQMDVRMRRASNEQFVTGFAQNTSVQGTSEGSIIRKQIHQEQGSAKQDVELVVRGPIG
ncbi:hypothetical protein MPTK1_6g10530 [Marchantia polymorpha subsp. ruderalis]|uniref:Uncharacterized protein n=2 Tax=Marchantia polymorpha TaxID=3197 RepID=A0AAF6BQL8_MARPO|nr:hypothetical protein MARPO_0016s0094 [Marchantia polymorpha]BBN14302.1 hypothetical protein Mp_6g10530 [Marchantia polymorpha subsp. ruderalis]|eukprot:PTQ45036.1 hypothetical protein MARPO_0016s0094 [Marchantia polymorpha]